MSISLAELVGRLQSDVPERDSLPDALQCERLVKDAVGDLGRRAGRYKIATLSVVSGTASYALPADFIKLVKLESLVYPDNLMHTAAGLVPLSQNYSERYTIAGTTITFWPTPAYSMDRYVHYQAGWSLGVDLAYAELEESQAEMLLKQAACGALLLQANFYAQQAWQYGIGDERVSKERLAAELRAQADVQKREYLAAVATYNGPYGARSEYSADAYQ